MGDQAARSPVEHGVVGVEPGSHVVRRQDGVLGGGRQAVGTHEGDVGPADGQDGGRAVGRRADGGYRL